MEQFLSYLVFDPIGITLLTVLIIALCIQLYFYLSYYKEPLKSDNNKTDNTSNGQNQPSVSVIIISKNDSENLAKNLPIILTQNYPNYEVVVVNDGSTDQTELILKTLKKEYPHLYNTFAPISYENESRRQKILSLTIGIKAAHNDILLFTETDICPANENWISSMINHFSINKDIVLGYCRFEKKNKFWGRIAVFDNLIFTLQYMSMTLRNKPFAGTYRNLAYRKKLFFDNKGFASALNFDNAETIFLNNVMTKYNTTIATSPDSFVTLDLDSYAKWKFIKSEYMSAKRHFSNFLPNIFHLETFTRYLFYLTLAGVVAYSFTNISHLWLYGSIAIILFFVKTIIQKSVINKASEHFEAGKFNLSFSLMELLQPYYNAYFWRYSKKKKKEKRKA